MTVTARRIPMEHQPKSFIVLCGKRNGDGRQTCPGALADLFDNAARVFASVYAIFQTDRLGVWRLTTHARKQKIAGRPVSLRRSQPRPPQHAPDEAPPFTRLHYGRLGDRAGTILKTGPVFIECPRCSTVNELLAAWFV